MTTTTAPAGPNALGLVTRGEFVVDPSANVAVVPEGFSPVPDDPLGRYSFGMSPRGQGQFTPVAPENRCLRPELASAVQNIALRFHELFSAEGLQLVIGEGNSAGNHVTHFGGAFVDLYTNLSDARRERFVDRDGEPTGYAARLSLARNFVAVGGLLSYEESVALWLGQAIVDSGEWSRIVFEHDTVNELVEAYAAFSGSPLVADPIRRSGNRTHFFHLHLESTPDGYSRTCLR